jgi:hypothetical protein
LGADSATIEITETLAGKCLENRYKGTKPFIKLRDVEAIIIRHYRSVIFNPLKITMPKAH